jgi:hypothetical protein
MGTGDHRYHFLPGYFIFLPSLKKWTEENHENINKRLHGERIDHRGVYEVRLKCSETVYISGTYNTQGMNVSDMLLHV